MKPTKDHSSDNLKSMSNFFGAKNYSEPMNNDGSSELRRLPYHYHRTKLRSKKEPSSLDHVYPEFTSLADRYHESSEVRPIKSRTNWFGNYPQSNESTMFEPKSEIGRFPFSTEWFGNYPQVPEYNVKSDISLESALDSNILANSSQIERIPSTTEWFGNFQQTWDPDTTLLEGWRPTSNHIQSNDFFVPSKVFTGPQVFEGPVEFRGSVRFMGPIYLGTSSQDISQSLQRILRQ